MVIATTKAESVKGSAAKIPASRIRKPVTKPDVRQNPVSPLGSSLEEELQVLRMKNKVMSDTLKAIKETANKEARKNLELVWFARNRSRFPSHPATKRIKNQHNKELQMLYTADGDYYHGTHAGLLAATRMFKDLADISLIDNEHRTSEVMSSDDLMSAVLQHQTKIEAIRKLFPDFQVDSTSPDSF